MSHLTEPRASVISVMVVVLLLGGCKVGPDYTVPEAPVADAWLEADNPAVRSEESDNYKWCTGPPTSGCRFRPSASPIQKASPRDRGRPGLVGFLPDGRCRWTHL